MIRSILKSVPVLNLFKNIFQTKQVLTTPMCRPKQRSLIFRPLYKFSKVSKKDQDRKEKREEKSKIKSELSGEAGNTKTVDFDKFEIAYDGVIQKFRDELGKMKVGRLETSTFSNIYIRVGADSASLPELAQITSKNANTCIIAPYNSDHLDQMFKVLCASDLGL